MKEVSEVKKKLSSLKSEVLLESLQSMIFRFYNYQSTPAVIYLGLFVGTDFPSGNDALSILSTV